MNSAGAQPGTGRIWLPEINIVRGFAILSVILIHVTAYFGRLSVLTPIAFVNMIADAFFHYAVPLFILISGLVLSLSVWKRGGSINFYKKRFMSILPQYVIFSILYISFSVVVLGWPISIPIFIGKLLTGTAWAHFWFIPLIVELYLLYPVLVQAYDYFDRRGELRTLLASAFIIQIGFSVAQVITNTVIIGEDAASQLILNSFPAYTFYFLAGIYAGRNIRAVKESIAAARVSWFAVIAITSGSIATLYYSTRVFNVPAGLSMNAAYMGWSLAMPLLTVAVFVLFFRLASRPTFQSSRTGFFINEMGTYAFGIYLIHPLFITGYELVLTHVVGISIESAAFYVLLASLTITSSYIFVKVVSRLPYGDWIIGVRTRKTMPQT